MSYRDELAALAAKEAALRAEVSAVAQEVARLRLPVLPNIRIATPCPAEWANMVGDERVRHCGECAKNVYNLSDMTRAEAEAVIREKEGKLCVRYYQRKDGTILTKDCPVGVMRRRRRRFFAASATALLAIAAIANPARSNRANVTEAIVAVEAAPHVTRSIGPEAVTTVYVEPVVVPSPPPIVKPVPPPRTLRGRAAVPRNLMGDVAGGLAPDFDKP